MEGIMIIRLTNRDRKDSVKAAIWLDPKAICFMEETEDGEAALCVSFSSEEYLTVAEPPEQIAALVAAAEREARIRENAARIYTMLQSPVEVGNGGSLAAEELLAQTESMLRAISFENIMSAHFAAERAAKKTGEEK